MRLLAGVIAFALWTAPAAADSDEWRRLMDAAMRSHQHGAYAIAGTKHLAALELAEGVIPPCGDIRPEVRRVPRTLNASASAYRPSNRKSRAPICGPASRPRRI